MIEKTPAEKLLELAAENVCHCGQPTCVWSEMTDAPRLAAALKRCVEGLQAIDDAAKDRQALVVMGAFATAQLANEAARVLDEAAKVCE